MLFRSTPVGGLLFSAPGQITATTGTEQPFKGWWSDTYGERRPATLLETEVIAGATAAWAISTEDIEITGSDRAVAVPGLTTEITWLDGGAELTVRVDNGRSHTRSIRW